MPSTRRPDWTFLSRPPCDGDEQTTRPGDNRTVLLVCDLPGVLSDDHKWEDRPHSESAWQAKTATQAWSDATAGSQLRISPSDRKFSASGLLNAFQAGSLRLGGVRPEPGHAAIHPFGSEQRTRPQS